MSELFTLWVIGIGAAAVTVIFLGMFYVIYKVKVLEREERRLMIERGMVPPVVQPNRGWPGVKTRELELKAEERRLRIEKGLDVGPEEAAPPPNPQSSLRKGLTLLGFGLGLAGAYMVFNRSGIDVSDETRNWFLFFGVLSPVLSLIGTASLAYYLMAKRRD